MNFSLHLPGGVAADLARRFPTPVTSWRVTPATASGGRRAAQARACRSQQPFPWGSPASPKYADSPGLSHLSPLRAGARQCRARPSLASSRWRSLSWCCTAWG